MEYEDKICENINISKNDKTEDDINSVRSEYKTLFKYFLKGGEKMQNFIKITDIQTGKTVLINIDYIETITEEAYGTIINLALQAPDCNEKNSYSTNLALDELISQITKTKNNHV